MPHAVVKAMPIISRECLQCWLDDVGGGDVDVILGTGHLGANLVDLDTLVPSGVAKKYVGVDLGAKHWNEPFGSALYGGADDPWPWAGQSATLAHERLLPCKLSDGPRLGPDCPQWRKASFSMKNLELASR
jgi:hypothetical protein